MHSGHMGLMPLPIFLVTSVLERTAKKIINGEPFKIEVLAGELYPTPQRNGTDGALNDV